MLFGIATSGVVLSTARFAADVDCAMNIISDCCFDRALEVHKALSKVLAGMAPPITSSEFIDLLGAEARSQRRSLLGAPYLPRPGLRPA